MPDSPEPQEYVSASLIRVLDRHIAEVRDKYPHDLQELPGLDYISDDDDTYAPQ